MGKEVARCTHKSKNGRIGSPFANVALMHLGPGINGGFVDFPGVSDKLVGLSQDRNSDSKEGSRWLKLLASLADAGGGLHSKPCGAQCLHMKMKYLAEILVSLAQGKATCCK